MGERFGVRSVRYIAAFVVAVTSVLLFAMFAVDVFGQRVGAQTATTNKPPTTASAVTPTVTSTANTDLVLRVATKPIEPFVFDTPALRGFSIDLMSDLSRRMGRRVEYVRFKKVTEVIDAVKANQVEAGIAAISITGDREKYVDFSLPMFDSGLQIVTLPKKTNTFAQSARGLFSATMLKFFVAMLVIIVIAGLFIYLADRIDEDRMYPKYADAAYSAAVQLVSVSPSAKSPKRLITKLGSVMWMLFGLFIVAQFTATLASSLTVSTLRSDINSVDDLQGRKVATVADTTSQKYLADRGITTIGAANFPEAMKKLDSGEVAAVVFDSPVVRYRAKNANGRYILAGAKFDDAYYGIAVPIGSPLREEFNAALLAARADGSYDELVRRWFGE
jgi:polar amino acid transport system substrate-binding protein